MCQQQLVQLQENLDLFNELDADIYAISTDTPDNSKRLKEAGAFTFTFLSDLDYIVLEHVKMKNDNMSYRGISILDRDGNYVYHQVNDLWGDQMEATKNIIYDQFDSLNE
ncbi:redoxin domain-containing protein [Alkalihalobacillus sp. MEB130]|uniref:redoxin domain-containing protein n=1 Tax=Alkalihalobacillus sp. MEB130 TaxID=2976704 RepID=UPI0028DF3693|nr:redoxin domain-containing protein [Alkalihalobacillus sp. MEB130]MDT8859610.1 redoxin domain-containing protein [Alkalihalobacillus sp. MEB130]